MIETIEEIKFSYSSPCERCPTMHGTDPMQEDIFSWSFKERMEERFTCAWRDDGFCYANAKTLFYGNQECGL